MMVANKFARNKFALFALIAALFASPVFADAMLVTVSFESGALSVRHAEMIAGLEPKVSSDGPFLLAYKQGSTTTPITRFYVPIMVVSDGARTIEESAEYTLSMPVRQGAEAIELYNMNNTLVSSLEISQIKSAGDSAGEVPKQSIAAQLGEQSVMAGITKATGANDAASGSQDGKESGTGAGKSGSCLPIFIFAVAGLVAFAAKR